MGAAWDAGLVQEAVAYIAPKVVGGLDAPSAVAGVGVACMAEAHSLGEPRVSLLGGDVRVVWRVGATPTERAGACVACGPLGVLGAVGRGEE